MSNTKKTAMIVAGACIAAGLLVILAAMILIRFDIRRLNTMKFDSKTYEVQETFQRIDIHDVECDVRLLPADDGQCRVVCVESDRIVNTVEVKDGALTVTRQDNRRWYERMGIWWTGDADVTVYLPEREYQSIVLKTVSGEIDVPEDFTFTTADVTTTSGDISFLARATGGLSLKSTSGKITAGHGDGGPVRAVTTSGDIRLSDTAAEELSVKTTSGEVFLSRVTARELEITTTSGEMELRFVRAEGSARLESVSGDVDLQDFDAADITVKTTSGDVDGSLLSPKAFEIHTTSGGVRVPPSDPSGGTCTVKTTSGDVEIEVKP